MKYIRDLSNLFFEDSEGVHYTEGSSSMTASRLSICGEG